MLGYGNPGRQDDGLGPAVVAALEADDRPEVTLDADYQLNIEDAAALAEHDIVLFVDASVDAPAPFALNRIAAAQEIAFTSHTLSAEAVLAMCEEHFGASPEAWVLGIRGYAFEFVEELTPEAEENCRKAIGFIRELIQRWRNGHTVPAPSRRSDG